MALRARKLSGAFEKRAPGRDFAIRTVSVETVISCVFFCFRKAENSKHTWPECHIISYLLTELARAVLRNIGPLSFLYVRSVRTAATTSGQYSSVRPSRSVSKRLLSKLSIRFAPSCLACVASVPVRSERNAVFHLFALPPFFARPECENPFAWLEFRSFRTGTLATQATSSPADTVQPIPAAYSQLCLVGDYVK